MVVAHQTRVVLVEHAGRRQGGRRAGQFGSVGRFRHAFLFDVDVFVIIVAVQNFLGRVHHRFVVFLVAARVLAAVVVAAAQGQIGRLRLL